eukprot:TRINITY_DN10525_c0_g1_i9.p2 TRINITY_DN10525_c0_g1~~TRINITY_DN10525_c0_g1_i9.p2  ORF type:complete len:391 (+),score=70.24 TRINITY_DN10525_c0_g1_i9:180-1352(+)
MLDTQNRRETFSKPTLVAINLEHDIEEDQFRYAFQPFNLKQCKICRYIKCHFRNEFKGTALAFLVFDTYENADAAKSRMNFRVMGRKELLLSRYDREMVKQKEGNLFVRGFSADDTNKDMYNFFSKFGEIFSSKLAQDLAGQAIGYGFVHYTDPNVTKELLEKHRTLDYHGKSLELQPYEPNIPSETEENFKTIYVNNLPPSIATEKALANFFSPYGTVLSSKLWSSTFCDRTGYFGLIRFEEHAHAQKAVSALNGVEVEGSVLLVSRALDRKQREQRQKKQNEEKVQKRRKSVYIKSVSRAPLEDAMVKEEFKTYNVEKISITKAKNVSGGSTNAPVGIVRFRSQEEMENVLAHYPGGTKLEVSKLECKEERKKRFSEMRRRNDMYFTL